MDYKPRYPQPFTLPEANLFEVSVITEEITRLQNSLQHLRQTQETLREYITSLGPGDTDAEVEKALEENKDVIGSQQERISMLNMVLAEKGVKGGDHYDLGPQATSNLTESSSPMQAAGSTITVETLDDESGTYNDGIHL